MITTLGEKKIHSIRRQCANTGKKKMHMVRAVNAVLIGKTLHESK
jgi:hypothetical protein